jgi:hypothetical protein
VAALGERGELYLRRGQVREAAEDFKTIITMEERNAGAWLGTNTCPSDPFSKELEHLLRTHSPVAYLPSSRS